MSFSLIMHVNYCEQGQSIEDICRKAVTWGFDGVEFRRKRIGVDESRTHYLDEIESGVRASGLREVLFGYPGPLLVDGDKAARRKEVDDAVSFYTEAAERFGVRTINLLTGQLPNPDQSIARSDYAKHGSFIATPEQHQWQVEGCRDMADRLSETGLRFGFETHPLYVHDTLEATLALVNEIDRPSIGINLDFGNLVAFGNHPPLEQAVIEASPRLYYVHLKNSAALRGSSSRLPTALSEGDINNREFLALLIRTGYDGPICIEAPRGGDREWYAQSDIAYLKSLLADFGM